MKVRAASRSAGSLKATSRSGAAPRVCSSAQRAKRRARSFFEAEIDLHPLDPGGERLGRQRGEINAAEIAAELVVQVHAPCLADRAAYVCGRGDATGLGLPPMARAKADIPPAAAIEALADAEGRLAIRATPNARQEAIVLASGGPIKVYVTVAPEHGRANEAVLVLLARALGRPRSALTLAARRERARQAGADRARSGAFAVRARRRKAQIVEPPDLAPPAHHRVEDQAGEEAQEGEDHQAGGQDRGREARDQAGLEIGDGERDGEDDGERGEEQAKLP